MIKKIFFFFQAEDGIRDLTVTGVQTCALPICSATREYRPRYGHSPMARTSAPRRGVLETKCVRRNAALRSEERRVGKECRSGWSRDHEKKKDIQQICESGWRLKDGSVLSRRLP